MLITARTPGNPLGRPINRRRRNLLEEGRTRMESLKEDGRSDQPRKTPDTDSTISEEFSATTARNTDTSKKDVWSCRPSISRTYKICRKLMELSLGLLLVEEVVLGEEAFLRDEVALKEEEVFVEDIEEEEVKVVM